MFTSAASNLAPCCESPIDVFVHDRDADGNGIFDEPGGIQTSRVSNAIGGGGGNSGAGNGRISADGRFIAFSSSSTDLVPNDTNGQPDVFLFDQQTGALLRINVGPTGEANGPSNLSMSGSPLSADGRYVVFSSTATNLVPFDGNGASDVFLYDGIAGAVTLVSALQDGSRTDSGGSAAPPTSNDAGISGDGSEVAFRSGATNLVADDTNGIPDLLSRSSS